ncbi:MAG: AMP-binding protein [Bdellovibrionaceae bacterium]|nr:AMP-binding protein [Pseudobdellovibrionaceae bacterium]
MSVDPRPWVKSYETGIPTDISITAYQSLNDLLEESFAAFSNRAAFYCMGKSFTFSEIKKLSDQFAAHLQTKTDLKPGDRVAIMAPNILQYPIALFACLKAGFVVVNVNPLYTARELQYQLKDSGAKAIVIFENAASILESVLPETDIKWIYTTGIGDMLSFPKSMLVNFVLRKVKKMVPAYSLPTARSFVSACFETDAQVKPAKNLTPETTAFLQYTGGTTGVSKGAVLSHGNMLNNVIQARTWIGQHTKKGDEIIITAMPGVNTLFNALLNNPNFANLDFSTLRLTLGGGMAVQRPVAEKWKAVTGKPLIEAYGLTETSPAACMNPAGLQAYNGFIGLPISSTYVEIRNDQNEKLPVGEVGEICIKGPQVMKGYWNKPDETNLVMTKDGFFKTGDLGFMNSDGYFKIVDRKKDMVLVSGFNVYPTEIEEYICSHEKVFEAAAIGVPDEKSGEAVKLVIVKKDPSLTEQEVIEFCRKGLTSYKVPRVVVFVDVMPKTNVGKILRRALK